MKKLFILALSYSFLSLELTAQVVITQSSFPTAGSVIYRNVHKTRMEFDAGSPGTSNVWNYGGLNSDSIATYNFINPNSTPYASSFPGTNLALEIDSAFYAYMKIDNTSASELGFEGDAGSFGLGGLNIRMQYNKPLTIMPFPSQYGTTFIDSCKGELRLPASAVGISQPGIDSVAIRRYIKRTGNFDASGSLTVNSENWQNALRLRKLEETTDSFFVKLFGTWTDASTLGASPTTENSLSYEWYVNGQNFPVLLADMNTIGDSALTLEFYAPGTAKSKFNANVFSVYPNPASDIIYFNGDMKNVQSVVVYNTVGQKLELNTVIRNNQAEISLNGLTNGIYIYQFIGKDNKIVCSGKFVVEK